MWQRAPSGGGSASATSDRAGISSRTETVSPLPAYHDRRLSSWGAGSHPIWTPCGRNRRVSGATAIAALGPLYWLLGSSVQKQALRDGERSAFPACKHSRGDVESDVVNSILMLEHRSFHMMEKLLLWLGFLPLSFG